MTTTSACFSVFLMKVPFFTKVFKKTCSVGICKLVVKREILKEQAAESSRRNVVKRRRNDAKKNVFIDRSFSRV